jgi:hypothetical protein
MLIVSENGKKGMSPGDKFVDFGLPASEAGTFSCTGSSSNAFNMTAKDYDEHFLQ